MANCQVCARRGQIAEAVRLAEVVPAAWVDQTIDDPYVLADVCGYCAACADAHDAMIRQQLPDLAGRD